MPPKMVENLDQTASEHSDLQSRTKSISSKSIFLQTSVYFMFTEIILRNYNSTDCNNFGTDRKLHELCKQYICFISVIQLIPK